MMFQRSVFSAASSCFCWLSTTFLQLSTMEIIVDLRQDTTPTTNYPLGFSTMRRLKSQEVLLSIFTRRGYFQDVNKIILLHHQHHQLFLIKEEEG
jgi:hypothetical protein